MFLLDYTLNLITSIYCEQPTTMNIKPGLELQEEDIRKIKSGKTTLKVRVAPSQEQYNGIKPEDTQIHKYAVANNLYPSSFITFFTSPSENIFNADKTPASVNLMIGMMNKNNMNSKMHDQYFYHKGHMIELFNDYLNLDPCEVKELKEDKLEEQLKEIDEHRNELIEEQKKKEEDKKKAAEEAQKNKEKEMANKQKEIDKQKKDKEKQLEEMQKKNEQAVKDYEKQQEEMKKKQKEIEEEAKKNAEKAKELEEKKTKPEEVITPQYVPVETQEPTTSEPSKEETTPTESNKNEPQTADEHPEEHPQEAGQAGSGSGSPSEGGEDVENIDLENLTPEQIEDLKRQLAEQHGEQQPEEEKVEGEEENPEEGEQPNGMTKDEAKNSKNKLKRFFNKAKQSKGNLLDLNN